jgi:hypothetical protein
MILGYLFSVLINNIGFTRRPCEHNKITVPSAFILQNTNQKKGAGCGGSFFGSASEFQMFEEWIIIIRHSTHFLDPANQDDLCSLANESANQNASSKNHFKRRY